MVEVALSDHTVGVGVAFASVALGASVIEKHFTLSRAEGGVDSAFPLEPHSLESLIVESERAWSALGEVRYGPAEAEQESLVIRRSIFVAQDISEGDVFTTENLRIVRPGEKIHEEMMVAGYYIAGKVHCYYGSSASRRELFDKPIFHANM